MLINITYEDIWREFIYYRSMGQRDIAFDHLRRYEEQKCWEAVIAGIAHHKYKLQIGDIIRVSNTNIEFVWDTLHNDTFRLDLANE